MRQISKNYFILTLILILIVSPKTHATISSGAVVIYQTTFNALSAGTQTVVGQDGWVGNPSPGPHGTLAAFPDQAQAMYIGSLPFSGASATFKRPVNYAPLDANTPLVRFTTEIMVNDSTNGYRDEFGFQIHNASDELLGTIIFDNELDKILFDDASGSGPVNTGISFSKGTQLFCDVEIDFLDNTINLWLGGVEVLSYETFTGSGKTMTLGDVSAYWMPHDILNPGDNQLILDNWAMIAYDYTTMVSNGIGITIQDDGPSNTYPYTNTITGLIGRLNRLTVSIEGFTHSSIDDVDIRLVAPDGRSIMLVSDAGGASSISPCNIVIDDLAPTSFMDSTIPVAFARYKPTDYEADPDFPPPAQNPPLLTTLSDFYGMNANGTWKLYIMDDTAGSTGSIAGWTLELHTDTTSTQTFADWQDTYFTPAEISGGQADEAADDDGDGMINLLEYAFGTNPGWSDTDSPNAPSTFPVTIDTVDYLCYQYVRDTSKTELVYEVEVSSDMVNWIPFTGSDTAVSQEGYVETRHALVPTDSGNNNIRLTITIP